MENPFELILDKLNAIDHLLRLILINQTGTDIKHERCPATEKEVLNLNQTAEYISLSKSAIYKKTSERNIPHFKVGKKLYFKRSELDEWLTGYRIKTKSEIEKEVDDLISIKKSK